MKYMNSPLLLDTYLQIMQELVEIMYDLNFKCTFKFPNFRTSKSGKNTLAKPDNPDDLRMPKHDEVCIKNCSKKHFYS